MEYAPAVVIAVDGPSGSGKSSASRGVALTLGLRYLDTGAMYRALTWWLLANGVDVDDSSMVAALAVKPELMISTDPANPWVRVGDQDVSREIRTQEVTSAVSAVARVPEVREHLIEQQRAIIKAARAAQRDQPGIVAEGRDIGTVVAPEADIKVYLTADSGARAARRAAEKGASVSQTESDQDRRDRMDAAQSAKAPDAFLLDSTDLTLDEVVAAIVDLARRIPEKTL